jgi:sporulation protein YqfC
VSGAPLITIVGAGDLTIENYKSILEYSDERARFLTAKGVVSAAGKRLHLRQITRERVVISGKIEKLEFL